MSEELKKSSISKDKRDRESGDIVKYEAALEAFALQVSALSLVLSEQKVYLHVAILPPPASQRIGPGKSFSHQRLGQLTMANVRMDDILIVATSRDKLASLPTVTRDRLMKGKG